MGGLAFSQSCQQRPRRPSPMPSPVGLSCRSSHCLSPSRFFLLVFRLPFGDSVFVLHLLTTAPTRSVLCKVAEHVQESVGFLVELFVQEALKFSHVCEVFELAVGPIDSGVWNDPLIKLLAFPVARVTLGDTYDENRTRFTCFEDSFDVFDRRGCSRLEIKQLLYA